MEVKKVWLVTGGSKGLGLTLIQKLLAAGYPVAATSRNLEELKKAVTETSASFLPLQVDLADEKSVNQAITDTIEKFGTLDVVVNNAGYGQIGTLEELTDTEARQNFEANVFGSLNIIRAAMPYLRAQKSGHILNIASIGGFIGTFPGWGIYCATKFAVVGFTEALAVEAKEFGIFATVVYPGYFKTNFLEKGSLTLPKNPIAAYTAARNAEQWHKKDMNGNQPGDPEKAALALIEVSKLASPPLHFFMGSDAYGLAHDKITVLQEQLHAHESLSKSTDFKH